MQDKDLLENLKALVKTERAGQAEFLRFLAEADERKLYLPEGFSSLFSYCTQSLSLSESNTAKRIQIARASRRFPGILAHIAQGKLTLTNASLLAPALTPENHESLLTAAQGKSKYDVEKLLTAYRPKPERPESIRRLPTQSPFASECPPSPAPTPKREKVRPVTPSRTQFTFSADDAFVQLFRKLQARLRHKFPHGKFEDIAAEALRLLDAKTDPARTPKRPLPPKSPAKHTRYIPAPVRHEVWQRDKAQCTFIAKSGQPCRETAFLELDHVIPWRLGGSSHDANNLTLRCRAHNQWREHSPKSPKATPLRA